MENHITTVGVLHIALSILGFLIGAFLFVLLAGIGFMTHDEDASIILPGIGMILGGFLFIISIPGLIGGWGLLKRREWARILLLVVSFLDLINIPIGTIVGGYSIWVLLHQDTVRLFNPVLPTSSPQA